eukprot:TRINITY_DN4849_c0_g1_i1.p1 TRINITY_DN4849_c0_g1~~TRINITY_DN4849_c0_g1_i1.p1  ORF type:complete len:203 (-),score=46.30 TRINITY_DN4849_c0_g1_i1:30-611(-)
MSTRTKKHGKKGDEEDRKEEDIQYMNQQQQAKFINQLQEQNYQSTYTFRIMFYYLCLVLAIGKFYMFIYQVFLPFQIEPHSDLQPFVEASTVSLTELFSTVSFATLAYYIRPLVEYQGPSREYEETKKKLVYWLSLLPVFPLYILYSSSHNLSFILFVWYGIGNIGLAIALFLIDWSLNDSEFNLSQLPSKHF